MKQRCHRIRATIEIDTIEWTVEHDDSLAAIARAAIQKARGEG